VTLKLVEPPDPLDDAIHAAALKAGCHPVWADGIFGWAWHCGCEGNLHGMDQQCSMLRFRELRRGL